MLRRKREGLIADDERNLWHVLDVIAVDEGFPHWVRQLLAQLQHGKKIKNKKQRILASACLTPTLLFVTETDIFHGISPRLRI